MLTSFYQLSWTALYEAMFTGTNRVRLLWSIQNIVYKPFYSCGWRCSNRLSYHSTLAASMLIILFSKMLKRKKCFFFFVFLLQRTTFDGGKVLNLRTTFSFVEMKMFKINKIIVGQTCVKVACQGTNVHQIKQSDLKNPLVRQSQPTTRQLSCTQLCTLYNKIPKPSIK